MKNLCCTTALVLAMGGTAFAAQGTDASASNNDSTDIASAGSFCDTGWAMVDTDNDGFVSADEAKSAMNERFKSLDSDGNGEVSQSEFSNCMSIEGTSASAERNDESFKSADLNQDKGIDRDEFRDSAEQAYNDYYGNAGPASSDDDSSSSMGDDKMASDDNASTGDKSAKTTDAASNDGILVLRRFVWLTPEESQNPDLFADMSRDEAAARSAQTFYALDENSDGIIDTREWSKRSPKSGMDEDWANANFDKLDKDSTGSISRDEYRQAQANMLDTMTTASTNADDGSEDQASSSASNDKGIPVYIYRFGMF